MTRPLPKLDYAPLKAIRQSSGAATVAVGWAASMIGLCISVLISIAACFAYERSVNSKGTGNRAVYGQDTVQLGICAALAGVHSLWFVVVGHRRVTRSFGAPEVLRN